MTQTNTSNQRKTWELQYVPGGRELLKSLGQQLVVGESFAFLGPQWGQTPMISSILRVAGVQQVKERLIPLWGNETHDLPGARLLQKPIPKRGLCSLWTDRHVYREYRDSVRLIMSDPFRPQSQVHVQIFQEGQLFGEQPLFLDAFGMCLVELQDLPVGRYRIQTEDAITQTEFTIAQSRLTTMSGEWVQQYTQEIQNGKQALVFVLQLESFGVPVRGDVAIQLLDESGVTPRPVSNNVFRADGGGRVAGDLMLEGDGPFSIEVHSLSDSTRWCTLQLGEEAGYSTSPKRSIIQPMGALKTWKWSGHEGFLGFDIVDEDVWQSTPMVLVDVVGQQAVLRAEEHIASPMLQVLDPVTGQSAQHQWEHLEAGQHIEIAIPKPGGVIVVGGWVHGEPWEGWSLAMPKPNTTLSLNVLPRQHSQEPLYIELATNQPNPLPVYVVVKEEEESEVGCAWGPSAAFQSALQHITSPMQVHQPSLHMWKKAPLPEIQTAQGSIRREIQRPSMPHPSIQRPSLPHPSQSPPKMLGAQPPGSGFAPPSMPHPHQPPIPEPPVTEAAWQRPLPQHEHFSKTYYSGIVTLHERHVLPIDIMDEHAQVQIEAVALSGPNWAYAQADILQSSGVFAELLLPSTCHPKDTIMGEVIVASQSGPVYIHIWCEQQQVPLYREGEYIDSNTLLDEDVIELSIPVVPGRYVMQIRGQDGVELDRVEAEVGAWGTQTYEGWGVQLLPAGARWEAPTGPRPALEAEVLPHLASRIQSVAKSITERPAGHCETEAARICAAAYSLYFSQSGHEESNALNQLVQGLERLEHLRVPGMGFRLFPGGPHEPKWGVEAIYHLWEVSWLPLSNPASPPEWYQRVHHLADEMARCYNLTPIPLRIHSARDAYRVFRFDSTPTRREEARWEIENRWQETPEGPQLSGNDAVEIRRESCYGALFLLSQEDDESRQKGLLLANTVLKQWSAEESGFSTLEGIALLALLHMCQQCIPSQGQLQVDEQDFELQQLSGALPFHTLHVHTGLAPVALRYHRLQRQLHGFSQAVPWRFKMQKPNLPQSNVQQAELGDRIELSIVLAEPGKMGDLLEFLLPPCLCWLDGEREEKYFAVEITGEQRISLPLVAVSTTQDAEGKMGTQRWGIRLFNMYDSLRGNLAFDNTISIFPTGHQKREQGVLRRWSKLFG